MENTIYDQVIEALVGGSYYLDVLLAETAHGLPGTRLDVQRLSVLRQQQMDAATAFQAWWQAHGTATGGTPCPR